MSHFDPLNHFLDSYPDLRPGALYLHTKTGRLYEILHVGINATNGAEEGFPAVAYRAASRETPDAPVFFRAAREFVELVALPGFHREPRFHLVKTAADRRFHPR